MRAVRCLHLGNRGRVANSGAESRLWPAKLMWARVALRLGGQFGIKTMLKALLVVSTIAMSLASPVAAEERVTLGWGRLFTNDALGDGRDRWRTGSYTVSRIKGISWSGELPTTPGEIVEFRFRADTIAPASLTDPDKGDRRYAGALSLGLHTHFDWKGAEISLGADLVATGPQTGISNFQSYVHKLLDLPRPQVLDDQIGNAVYPSVVIEAGRSYDFGTAVRVRPFVEARAGVETLLRVGGDLVIGQFERGDLMLRDVTTGMRYRGVQGNPASGFSFVIGGDIAQVYDSAFLPAGEAAVLSSRRDRLRAGFNWQGGQSTFFYGVTYLSPEFEQQPEGQVLGALNLNMRF